MKEFIIYVCDDIGNREYSKKIKANSLSEADNIANKWSLEVESTEGWNTLYDVEEL